MDYDKKHIEQAECGQLPWWEFADVEEFKWQLNRLRIALFFCKGRASSLKPILQAHIQFLEYKLLNRS